MKFEPVGPQRVKIDETLKRISISIPASRNWIVLLFVTPWLCGWTLGGFFAAKMLSAGPEMPVLLFMIFWLCGWAAGWLFAFMMVAWQIAGKETVILEGRALERSLNFGPIRLRKIYDRLQVCNLRQIESTPPWQNAWRGTPLVSKGTLAFDYGSKTVNFGLGLSDVERTSICAKLERRLGSGGGT